MAAEAAGVGAAMGEVGGNCSRTGGAATGVLAVGWADAGSLAATVAALADAVGAGSGCGDRSAPLAASCGALALMLGTGASGMAGGTGVSAGLPWGRNW